MGVAGVVAALLLIGAFADTSGAAAKRAAAPKPLTASLPKAVDVGEPFTVVVRNLRTGALVAIETPESALGWAASDAFGTARVSSSLWRARRTAVTITEVLNGARTRRLITSITVRAAVFSPPQTSPSPEAATARPADPSVTVVAANSCRSQSDPIRVWPLGDSLTVGGYGDPVGFTDSYRYVLLRLLRAEGIHDVVFRGHIGSAGASGWGAVAPAEEPGEFSHSGTGGITVAGLTSLLETILPVARPDVIVLNIGTNGGTPAEYRQLVARLQQMASTSVIVMGTLPPRTPELRSARPAGFRADINATVVALGAAPNDRLLAADVFTRMLGDANTALTTADYSDETHLSISGGAKFARGLLPEVREAIAQFRLSPCG